VKSVLISIQPKWCELIASGKKTVEVRKTRPKIETPFKVYIYCTRQKVNGEILLTHDKKVEGRNRGFRNKGDIPLAGKVIGEFVCDKINCLDDDSLFFGLDEISNSQIEEYSCVSLDELFAYKGDKEFLYAWHISSLVIYDKPKELREFRYYNPTVKLENGYPIPTHEIKRPPQSWCYLDHPTEKGGER
jgi:predicted transcriptional regulator